MSKKDQFDFLEVEEFDLESEVTENEHQEELIVASEAKNTQAKQTAQAQANAKAATSTKATAAVEEDEELEVVRMGKSVSANAFEKFKASTDTKARISFLTEDPFITRQHYNDTHKYFLCFKGECCMEASARVKYNFPVVVYETDKKGQQITSPILELKILSISEAQYRDLATIHENTANGLASVDIIITCSDAQYQKMTFTATQGTYKTHAKMQTAYQEQVAYWETHKKQAPLAIGKRMTREAYLQIANKSTGSTTNVEPETTISEDNFDF